MGKMDNLEKIFNSNVLTSTGNNRTRTPVINNTRNVIDSLELTSNLFNNMETSVMVEDSLKRSQKPFREERKMNKLFKKWCTKQIYKKRKRIQRDLQILRITPGTDFMSKAHDACLYWAWYRLNNSGVFDSNKIKIYISSSSVPGEGEVKLLDWLLQAGKDENVGDNVGLQDNNSIDEHEKRSINFKK